jgi:hypothetical protein
VLRLGAHAPVVSLSVRHDKSRRGKRQPLPADVADLFRAYLDGKPAGSPLWPGTWAQLRAAAAMLRKDLKAAGIPYTVQGHDGPEHADFHALRHHTYLTLLGRSGVDLRTQQELAGHTSPVTTARYSHVRLHDLAGAVDRLPDLLLEQPAPPEALAATGTDGAGAYTTDGAGAYTPLTQEGDGGRGKVMEVEAPGAGKPPATASTNPLCGKELDGGKGRLMETEGNGRYWIRTSDFHRVRTPLAHPRTQPKPLQHCMLHKSPSVCKHMRMVSCTCEN